MNRPVAFALYSIFTLIFLSAVCDDPPTNVDTADPSANVDSLDDTIPTTMTQEHIPWPSLADTPWPMYRHDPQGTGRSQYVGPQLGEIALAFTDSNYSEGSIAIGDSGILYFTSEHYIGSHLYAVSPAGQIRWKRLLDSPSGNKVENPYTPTITSADIIYVPTWQRDHYKIHAIRTDGSEHQTYQLDDALYSNIIPDLQGNLYFISNNPRRLTSITSDGTLLWETSVPGEFHNGPSPAVFSPDGSTLYSGGGDSLYAITTTGVILWGYWTERYVWYSIVDNNGNIYFYNPGDSSITSLNPSGEVNWRTYISARMDAPTIDKDGNLYFSSDDGIISLKGLDGSLRWTLDVGAQTGLGCDANSNLYFGGYSTLYCASPEGALLWQVEAPEGVRYFVNGPAIGAGGVTYFSVWANPLWQVVGVK
ncbi:MAG: PQQ-binding-like beta-propeller repeat protein [Candidatus Neomarinimicrobiota bacterium]